MPETVWLRYVPHADVPAFAALGWQLWSPMRGNHGAYAVLMIWGGAGEPT